MMQISRLFINLLNLAIEFNTLGLEVWKTPEPYQPSQEKKKVFYYRKDVQLMSPKDIVRYPNGSELCRPYMIIEMYDNPYKLSLENWVRRYTSITGYCLAPKNKNEFPAISKEAVPRILIEKTAPYKLVSTDNACES